MADLIAAFTQALQQLSILRFVDFVFVCLCQCTTALPEACSLAVQVTLSVLVTMVLLTFRRCSKSTEASELAKQLALTQKLLAEAREREKVGVLQHVACIDLPGACPLMSDLRSGRYENSWIIRRRARYPATQLC